MVEWTLPFKRGSQHPAQVQEYPHRYLSEQSMESNSHNTANANKYEANVAPVSDKWILKIKRTVEESESICNMKNEQVV